MTVEEFKRLDLKEVASKVEKIMHKNGYRNFSIITIKVWDNEHKQDIDWKVPDGFVFEDDTLSVTVCFKNKDEYMENSIPDEYYNDCNGDVNDFISDILEKVFECLIFRLPSLKFYKKAVEDSTYDGSIMPGAIYLWDATDSIVRHLKK